MTTWTLADFVPAYEDLFATYLEWVDGFDAEDLATQSLCPEWDVRGVIGHTIGVEALLDGWTPSTETPPPFERVSDVDDAIADRDPAAVATEIHRVLASRLDHLRSLPSDASDAPSMTPLGMATYGRFLRVRAFDLWVHAYDIAVPLNRPVTVGPRADAIALDEVASAIGYIVGKKVGLPDGMSAVVHVTGENARDIAAAVVNGKGRPVASVEDPDVEVTADLETFVLLAAGRLDPQERIDADRITWTGDAEWGEQMARNLAYII